MEKILKSKKKYFVSVRPAVAYEMDTQNTYLLLNLLHRLHHPDGLAWALWAMEHVNQAELSGALHGTHWAALRDLLPAYQHITKVSIGDGRSTDFWKDCWL